MFTAARLNGIYQTDKEGKMARVSAFIAVAALVSALAAGTAAASQPGGHGWDLGVLLYGEDSDRGGAKLEGRYNLSPEESAAALYAAGGLGLGTWLVSTKPGAMTSFLNPGGADNYVSWKGTQMPFMDLGLGFTYDVYSFEGGLTTAWYDLSVRKVKDGVVYVPEKEHQTGFAWGGYIQAGYEVPVGRWFVDLALGYRATRGKISVDVSDGAGHTEAMTYRPISGLYAMMGLRYRF
jgi:hypothetical protein